jgi:hypothetical protein
MSDVDLAASSSPRAPWWLALVGIALFTWGTGVAIAGRDFGDHWDEWYAQEGAKNEINAMSAFPGEFTYHWAYFDLATIPLLPAILKATPSIVREIRANPTRPLDLSKYPSIVALQKQQLEYINSMRFIVDGRAVYSVCSYLGVFVMLALMMRLLQRPASTLHISQLEAALIASLITAIFATGYEYSYHARYIAVDSIMAMLTLCMLYAAVRALHGSTAFERQLWWSVTGVVGGLVFGCKVTGIMYCIPIGVCAFLYPEERTWRGRFRRLANAALWYCIAAYISTPGAFRQPFHLWGGIAHTAATYLDGKFGYQVDSFGDMLVKLPRYMFLYAPTPWPWLSLPVSLLTFVGMVRWWRVARRSFVFALLFVLAYVGFIMSAGQIQVRNTLAANVVWLVAAGFGVQGLLARGRLVRIGTVVALVAIVVANAVYGAYAVSTIQNHSGERVLTQARAWLAEQTGHELLVAPRLYKDVADALVQFDCSELMGASTVPADANVALYFDEHPRRRWQAHDPAVHVKDFHSLEVNLIFYPNWRSKFFHERVVVTNPYGVRRHRMDVSVFHRCRPKG